MSHESNLAITIPEEPLILAAPALLIVVILAVIVFRKRRSTRRAASPWATASEELGIEFVKDGSDHGAMARGKVNNHVVCIAPTAGSGRRKRKSTLYNVKYEAPEAPKFVLTKRVDDKLPVIDTGNPKFDAVVAVRTGQPDQLTRFLTPTRRAAILRLLTYWPVAQITNREAHLKTPGLEDDVDKLVDSICHLVAAAEAFDKPTPRIVETETTDDKTEAASTASEAMSTDAETEPAAQTVSPIAREAAALLAEPVTAESNMDDLVAAARAIYESGIDTSDDSTGDDGSAAERDVLTEVRLDEMTVLRDLFNSGLDQAGIAARFEQVYQGAEVSWSGEVLRVGSTDRGLQRIAAFIGSADGQHPDSGRVVALTAVDEEPALLEGDVVSFSGTLVNLDASQRLFHVV